MFSTFFFQECEEEFLILKDLNEYYTRAILYEFDLNNRDEKFIHKMSKVSGVKISIKKYLFFEFVTSNSYRCFHFKIDHFKVKRMQANRARGRLTQLQKQ